MSPIVVTSLWLNPSAPGGGTTVFRREDAIALMHEYVKNENLRRHMYACEVAMRDYAPTFNGQPDEWGIVGLLHDFDWEIHPTMAEHPSKGQSILEAKGVPALMRRAIMAHAEHTGVIPETAMEKSMFAVDELTGFIVACALVTPERSLADVTVERIQKKLKEKSFAAKVNRADIAKGVVLIGVPETEHFQRVLTSMQRIHEILGL